MPFYDGFVHFNIQQTIKIIRTKMQLGKGVFSLEDSITCISISVVAVFTNLDFHMLGVLEVRYIWCTSIRCDG